MPVLPNEHVVKRCCSGGRWCCMYTSHDHGERFAEQFRQFTYVRTSRRRLYQRQEEVVKPLSSE